MDGHFLGINNLSDTALPLKSLVSLRENVLEQSARYLLHRLSWN